MGEVWTAVGLGCEGWNSVGPESRVTLSAGCDSANRWPTRNRGLRVFPLLRLTYHLWAPLATWAGRLEAVSTLGDDAPEKSMRW